MRHAALFALSRDPEPSPPMALVYLADLTPDELAVLEAIVAGSWAWVAQIGLVAAGHEPETIARVTARGLVEPWDVPADPDLDRMRHPPPVGLTLTLTPWGAEILNVEIVEVGEVDRPKWFKRPVEIRRPNKMVCYMLRLPKRAEEIIAGPEYLRDEESGEIIRVFQGQSRSTRGPQEKPLKGGVGGGADTGPGLPIERGKRRLKGKKK
jgi:hypothetical protein